MRRLSSWLPPLAWMAIVLWVSGDSWSAAETGRIVDPLLRWLLPGATTAQLEALHAGARKLAHSVEYALLALLWFRALRRERAAPRPAAWIALLVAAAWALLDEGRQSATASRSGSVVDVMLDVAGATGALALARGDWRRAVDATTTAFLAATCAGGGIAIAVNALAGVHAIALWVTTPIAALLLLLRRRRGTR